MKPPMTMGLPLRAYHLKSSATDWSLIWESGPYLRRFAELLRNSREFVILLGWQIDSRLRLPSPDMPDARLLRNVLREHCEAHPGFRAYLLLWAHPVFYMPLREWWQRSLWAQVHPRVHFVMDSLHPFGASHHEKLIIFDGKKALCGGVDLCAGRWDSPHHRFLDPLRSLSGKKETHGPYHDLSVEVEGPVVRDLWEHAAWRWNRTGEIPAPPPPPSARVRPREEKALAGAFPVYVSRTSTLRPAVFHPSSHGHGPFPQIREAESSMISLIRLSQRSILIESQYFWSEAVTRELERRIERVPRSGIEGEPFRIRIILADLRRIRGMSRLMAEKTYTLLLRLEAAAARNPGVLLEMTHPQACRRGHRSRPVYVHSKLMVVDDRWLSIGSVNLSDRAFRLDSEIQLAFEADTPERRGRIRALARQVVNHWRRPPGLTLQRIAPRRLRRKFRRRHPLLWRIPWGPLVDPSRPWLEGVVRRISRLPVAGRLFLRLLRPARDPMSPCLTAPNRSKKRNHAANRVVQHPQGIQRG